VISTDGDYLDSTRIELITEFFPSPQLGDTVGSPVGPEKFNQ
jgi:hypothetical protein